MIRRINASVVFRLCIAFFPIAILLLVVLWANVQSGVEYPPLHHHQLVRR
jgi:hypothetical protein